MEIFVGLSTLQFGVTWISVIIAITDVGAGACLLYGAIRYHQSSTIFNLVFSMIGIVFYVISACVALAASTEESAAQSFGLHLRWTFTLEKILLWKEVWIAFGVYCLGMALIDLYFWLCVFSFFKRLKSRTLAAPI